jgi:uncharacterized protein (DUF4415 family)
MKKHSSSRTSESRLAAVRAMPASKIKLTEEHPEADVKHIVRGIVRRGLQPVAKKQSIALRVDADVLEWFRSQGRGYQSRMNAVLRAYRDASL